MKSVNTNYCNIDMEETGKKLRSSIFSAGFTVKDIQNYLQLSCPQPIYRWFKGKMLPSVDHLYMLSLLLGMHMEELLVAKVQKAQLLYAGREYQRKDNNMIIRLEKYLKNIHAA